jgi:hypothetical protein
MASEPAPGTGRDDDPVPHAPVPGRIWLAGAGLVTPDWMDDADWQRACAARVDDDCPFDEDGEWYCEADDGPPPELADVPFGVLAARATPTVPATRGSSGPAPARLPRSRRARRLIPGRLTRCWASGPMRPPARTGLSPE